MGEARDFGWGSAGSLVEMGLRMDFPLWIRQRTRRAVLSAEGVRVVRGSAVRSGLCVQGVVVMPPAYVNVGAYVDEGTMVDSHALVGSLRADRQARTSEPPRRRSVEFWSGERPPVIIEEDCLIGGIPASTKGNDRASAGGAGRRCCADARNPVYDLVDAAMS